MRHILAALALVVALVGGPLLAQSTTSTPIDRARRNAAQLEQLLPAGGAMTPREVELELALDDAKRTIVQREIQLEALKYQMFGLSATVDKLLEIPASPAIERANAESRALNERIVRALGGDPAKGDTYDRTTKALVRKDGARKPEPRP